MGFYRRIDVRMHGDDWYLSLSAPQPNGRSLFEWLIHGPLSNSIGLYPAGKKAMAEAIGWNEKAFDKAFREVSATGKVSFCEDHRLLFVHNFLRYNPPGSSKVCIGWINLLDSLPQCHLKYEWVQQFLAYAKAFPKAFPQGFEEAYAKAARYSPSPSPSPSQTPIPPTDCDKISESEGSVLSVLSELTGTEWHQGKEYGSNLRARLKSGSPVEDLIAIVRHKSQEWGANPEMRKNLNPTTLFRPKHYDLYLAQAKANGNGHTISDPYPANFPVFWTCPNGHDNETPKGKERVCTECQEAGRPF